MKKKEFAIINLILAIMVIIFGWMTFRLSLNHSIGEIISGDKTVAQVEEESTNKGCSEKSALTIKALDEPHLKRLNDYQDLCGSFVTDQAMVFAGFSENEEIAQTNATAMAEKLKEFAQAGVSPIVVVEPYISDQAMPYKTYLSGAYDQGMDSYFAKLKSAGITDKMMGTWVPFPESNTPSWNNKDTEPRDFALCVNKFLVGMKKHFPGAKGSVLLSATTYDPSDTLWENGDYISLTPYVDALDRDLVTSFGIQGFPWITNAQQRKHTIFNAPEFLQPDLAIGAAQVLRTRDIWINTGTFDSKYTDDPDKTVHVSINERKALLANILQVAINIREYQQNEYRVSVNLFSEDKSEAIEATDWSYFQNVESRRVLKDFLTQADETGVPISLYDKAHLKFD